MEAKELMILDWICITYFDEPICAKVTGLVEYEDGYCVQCGDIIYDFGSDDIKPIPLAKEIFLKNGFRESEIEEGVYNFPIEYKGLTARGFAIETDDGLSFYITDHQLMKFDCVNKFQHALRLCGLNELADNFKV